MIITYRYNKAFRMIKYFFFICLIRFSEGVQDYDELVHRLSNGNSPRMHMFDRITLLSRQIYEDAIRRIMEINEIRYMYEETVEYESGYIMGEIIERYRKLMEEGRMVYANLKYKYHAQRHGAPDLLNRVEKAQQIYFEEYHLVRIMHEIIPKYKSNFKTGKAMKMVGNTLSSPGTGSPVRTTKKKYDHDKEAKRRKKRAEERERKRKEKMEEAKKSVLEKMKDREFLQNKLKYNHYTYDLVHNFTRRPTVDSKGLPFDYGWEIGHFN